MEMKIWQKQVTDLYILANDIMERLVQQRHGYKNSFYYAFNNKLEFLICDGSDIQQFKLLQQLSDKGLFRFEEEAPTTDTPKDFISDNALKNQKGKTHYLTIDFIKFYEQLGNLKEGSMFNEGTDQTEKLLGEKIRRTTIDESEKVAVPPLVSEVMLSKESYDKRKGRITFAPSVYVDVAKSGLAKNKKGKKYQQCVLLDYVFKSVKSMSDGASFSAILSVHSRTIGAAENRKIKNYRDAINKKVKDKLGYKELLKISKQKVYINKTYLY